LFVLGNNPWIAPTLSQLTSHFTDLVAAINAAQMTAPGDYHIGFVTSDLGAGQYNINRGQCHPGGDGARLQPRGLAADPTCQVPNGGVNFVEYDQHTLDAAGNPTSNLPPGADLTTQLQCMAAVSDVGCPFVSPLEAAYQALSGTVPENHDFLRPDALLVVYWLSDHDDCSAPPNTDLFDTSAAGMASYGALLSYRCTQFGIACGSPPMLMPYGASGPLTNCVPATAQQGSKLLDVQRYIDFFTKPAASGGIKDDPRDVILSSIDAPTTPVSSILANLTAPVGPYQTCAGPISTTCGVVLQHSCVSQTNTGFFGDPPIRLQTVLAATPSPASLNGSICDTSYGADVQALAQSIVARLQP
jgi:hypothetical protein